MKKKTLNYIALFISILLVVFAIYDYVCGESLRNPLINFVLGCSLIFTSISAIRKKD